MAGLNETSTFGDDEQQVGILSQVDSLSLGGDELDAGAIIGRRIEQGKEFWNNKLNLDDVRENNERYYLNMSFDEKSLYDYQVPYKDNRIFLSVETVIPMLNSRPPQPVVTQGNNTPASYELAINFGNVLLTIYEDLFLKQKTSMLLRHLLIGYRLGVMKYSWDTSIGAISPDTGERMGGLAIEVIRPHKITLDAEANDVENIPLIDEIVTNTAEELCLKFPEKQDDIYRELGFKRGVRSQMNKRVGYHETWFSYYDKKGTDQEAVSWELGKTILGQMKNPHYNYDEYEDGPSGEKIRLNFFDKPKKPYILFNFLNLGKYVLDDTSLTEQAIPLQDILNKRGRQIVENADAANSGTVLNEGMISQDDAAKLIGDPLEKVMVDGDVRMAASRLPMNLLPDYVLQDKNDARNEIDNIYGTHAPIRGEKALAPTLGQEVLSQRSDMGRTLTISDCIEGGFTRLYKGVTQMIKVFWDETQNVQHTGPDGHTTFIEFNRSKVEEGVKIKVKEGSALPEDRFSKREETIKMFAGLDPLSIAEGLSKPNPKEYAKRLVYWRYAVDKYMTEVLQIEEGSSGMDPDAVDHIKRLSAGEMVEPIENPTKEHLATHNVFMKGQEYQALDPEIQKLHLVHVRAEVDKAKSQLSPGGTGEAPAATPEEGGAPMGPQPEAKAPGNTPAQPGAGAPAAGAKQNIFARIMSRFTGAK